MVSSLSIHSQDNSKENIEFLSRDSYEALARSYKDSSSNFALMQSFADAFLAKAKRERDSLKLAEGYYKIASVYSAKIQYDIAKKYLDSTILFSKGHISNRHPARAYILRANINGAQTNMSDAMDDLGHANTYAKTNGNIEQQYEIKYFISLLKNSVGEHEEAISLLKEIITYYEQGNTDSEIIQQYHFFSLYALGAEYNTTKEPYSALTFNKKAIEISLKQKDSLIYDRLLRSAGFSYYLLGDYQRALDSVLKSKRVSETKENLAVSTPMSIHTTLGLIYHKLQQAERSHFHLLKMDSIAFAENYYSDVKEPYKLLIQYYKERENSEKQLFFINRLLYADSVVNSNKQYVSQRVNEDYDIPNLIEDKKRIISELQKEKRIWRIWIVLLLLISLVLLLLFIRYYRRQKLYKKRFQQLLENSENSYNVFQKSKVGAQNKIDIPKDIVENVLKKLEDFEENQNFLRLNLSLADVAKECGTNTKYFSKIINTYKNKTFTQYINDLRIAYTVNTLRQDSKIRRFTIKAIANEMGFNTTEAFSKSFYKSTGIYPSFFIKQLEKQ